MKIADSRHPRSTTIDVTTLKSSISYRVSVMLCQEGLTSLKTSRFAGISKFSKKYAGGKAARQLR